MSTPKKKRRTRTQKIRRALRDASERLISTSELARALTVMLDRRVTREEAKTRVRQWLWP